MRKYLIAGNFKMHGFKSQMQLLINNIKAGVRSYSNVDLAKVIDIAICPSFIYLQKAHEWLSHTGIFLGAQNLYLGKEGAYTGEISGSMLADIGCQFVIIGHSERRTIFQENTFLIAQKCKSAISFGLKPILCVGESKDERESGKTKQVIDEQISSLIQFLGIDAFLHMVIAYEPVWAIGTGLTATPEEAQEVHAFIRALIAKNNVDIAETIRILYGGSMKPDNASALIAMPDVDGGLIGGASLDANSFLAICVAAYQHEAAARDAV